MLVRHVGRICDDVEAEMVLRRTEGYNSCYQG